MVWAFIDTNIPMYASGRGHRLKTPSRRIIEAASASRSRFFTDAEVLQEIVHRYQAISAWQGRGQLIFEEFFLVMEGRIEPMFAEDVQRAVELTEAYPQLSARDLVHVAVMERAGATAIVTADSAFDNLDGVERLDPANAASWLPRFEDED